ncbi:hypothetical protein ASG36_14680 [Geodermatophilus sp. Leaf369]|nr:hypothetical protein ASG36_14680 [Geodermatophilus sp. Leaf369]
MVDGADALPDGAWKLVNRMLPLWMQLVEWTPRGDLVLGTSEEWADYLSPAQMRSITDVAVVRWGQLYEVVAAADGTSGSDSERIAVALLDLGRQLAGVLHDAYSSLPDVFDSERLQAARLGLLQLRDAFDTELQRRSISQAAAEVQQVRDATRVNAGEIATGELAQHFEKYRSSERRQAEILRVLAGLIIVGTVVALARLIPGDRTTAEVIQRGAFSVPLFAVAAYLAAESARHRKAAQWAGTLRVQLLTVDLFTKPLDATEAASVRMILANRAFGEVPMLASGNGAKEEAAMPVSVQAVLERLLVEMKARPEK